MARRVHGSPYDRGSADSYYRRSPKPHKGHLTGGSILYTEGLTPEEIAEYHAGYDDNEADFNFKDWG